MDLDRIENILGALVQHGPFNDRAYMMKLGEARPDQIAGRLIELGGQNGYTKIFAKVPEPAAEAFKDAGYRLEAFIPGFYPGGLGGCFLGYYLDDERGKAGNQGELEEILDIARGKSRASAPRTLADGFTLAPCTEDDVEEMAIVYKVVFPTYPFPIHDPGYLKETMLDNVKYFKVTQEQRIVALSSAEIDRAGGNVEMTDFATLPDFRGHSFGIHLLKTMEAAMVQEGIPMAYTIARAVSAGMNVTFARGGYQYGGRLINNTNISGSIESMNIWYRPLN